jgi:geranylgeranyl diphosphate synthase type I
MRAQVMVGQFLDTLAPAAPIRPVREALAGAAGVALAKSAHYSVTFPLLVGALAAGADEAQVRSLAAFGTHLGFAFQLRDDLLGVFGDPSATGKAAHLDLAGGKRTVLVALARAALPPRSRTRLEQLTAGGAGPEEVAEARTLIARSGADDDVERLIARSHRAALTALDQVDAPALGPLAQLAAELAHRTG